MLRGPDENLQSSQSATLIMTTWRSHYNADWHSNDGTWNILEPAFTSFLWKVSWATSKSFLIN